MNEKDEEEWKAVGRKEGREIRPGLYVPPFVPGGRARKSKEINSDEQEDDYDKQVEEKPLMDSDGEEKNGNGGNLSTNSGIRKFMKSPASLVVRVLLRFGGVTGNNFMVTTARVSPHLRRAHCSVRSPPHPNRALTMPRGGRTSI